MGAPGINPLITVDVGREEKKRVTSGSPHVSNAFELLAER